jgi:pilus assembly protein CpaF
VSILQRLARQQEEHLRRPAGRPLPSPPGAPPAAPGAGASAPPAPQAAPAAADPGQAAVPAGPLPGEVGAGADGPPRPASPPTEVAVRWDLVLQVLRRLAAEADDGEAPPGSDGPLEARIRRTLDGLLAESGQVLSRVEKEEIVRHAHQEIAGYGPLQPLLEDDGVSEIMVNGPDDVYVERGGQIQYTGIRFRDHAHLLQTIQKIVAPLGRRIDESSPMVDARLPDGSRVNAVIPPLAVRGAALTIRKFSRRPLGIDDLVARGTLVPEMAMLLRAAVAGRLNIVVSGGTGSGKTTTLNVLSSFIGEDERIVTIEDAAELRLQQRHVVSLEARPANAEGRGRVTIRDLVINALRMRPDRIIVGEVRGGEALDMLQAMNTGHDGSLTTAHANSPRELLYRLETMVLMAGTDLPARAIREQIASAIDLIVHQARLRDGTRRITHITEVVGMEGDTITLQDIFVFEQQGVEEHQRVRGRFRPTGVVPTFLPRLEARGQRLPQDLFWVPDGGG